MIIPPFAAAGTEVDLVAAEILASNLVDDVMQASTEEVVATAVVASAEEQALQSFEASTDDGTAWESSPVKIAVEGLPATSSGDEVTDFGFVSYQMKSGRYRVSTKKSTP